MKKKVTIRDIADAVGYSKTTVSRYLNGQTHMMSTQTAERIKNVIDLMDYQPSDLARSLKTKRSYTVGIVISDISSPFASSVVVGSGEVLEEHGYVPLFINCHEEAEREESAIASLTRKGVDGLIVNTTSPDNDFLYDYVLKGIPIVLCDRKLRKYNMDIVEENNERIISILVSHLKEQGYTRIALFTQEKVQSSAKDIRKSQFLKSVKEQLGYDAGDDVFRIEGDDIENAVTEFERFMGKIKEGEVPAIIGANTVITMLLYRAIKNSGYFMPDDIGLCGTNGWSWHESVTWMELLRPAVTCVTIDGYELGRSCARRVLEKIEDPYSVPKHTKIDVKLEIGESTQRNR